MKRKLSCLEKIGIMMAIVFAPIAIVLTIQALNEMKEEKRTVEATQEASVKAPLPEFDPVTGENMQVVIAELQILHSRHDSILDLRESAIDSYISLLNEDDATVYLTIEDTIYPSLDRYYKEILVLEKFIETKRVRAIYDKMRTGAMSLTLAMGQVKNTLTRNNADLLDIAKKNVSESYGKIKDAEDELVELVVMYAD